MADDLRVVKTKKTIRETFLRLICEKPVNKISVTGLANAAEINKSTFYLHYLDIYDLYDEIVSMVASDLAEKFDPYPYFFENPEEFVRIFFYAKVAPPTLVELAVLKDENLRFSMTYPDIMIDAFRKKLVEAGRLEESVQNNVRLDYLLTGMLALLIRPGLPGLGNPEGDPYIIAMLAGSIRQVFPEFFSKKTTTGS